MNEYLAGIFVNKMKQGNSNENNDFIFTLTETVPEKIFRMEDNPKVKLKTQDCLINLDISDINVGDRFYAVKLKPSLYLIVCKVGVL